MTKNIQKYTDQIIQSFPAELKEEILKVIDILPLNENSVQLIDGNIHFLGDLIHETNFVVNLNGESLIIPYRLYFNEPAIDKEESLTKIQRVILNCIYLRHHNGYIRQKRLEKLEDNFEYFIVPHTLQLLGEYVIQILEVLDRQINDSNIKEYKEFINENPLLWRRTQKRMVSYWNEKYRHTTHKKLRNYIGTHIANKIKKG